jgi:hypothetical protein
MRKNPLSKKRLHHVNDLTNKPTFQRRSPIEEVVDATRAKSLKFSGQQAVHSDKNWPLASSSSFSKNLPCPQKIQFSCLV